MTQSLDPTVFVQIADQLEAHIQNAEANAVHLGDGVKLGLREWTSLRSMARAAVMLLQGVKWNDMANAPKDRPLLVRIDDQVRSVHWYEPWGNWQDVGMDMANIDPERGEIFGIGAKVPTGWMDPPVAEPVAAPAPAPVR